MKADDHFREMVTDAPETEGIKYAGSKRKLVPFIIRLAQKVKAKNILDGFSGTTRVAQAFSRSGYRVVANDVAVWSKVFGTCYLLNQKERNEYEPLIEHLNSAAPIDGWFTEKYGGLENGGSSVQGDGFKKPWQVHNTKKLDGIREEIDRLSLSEVEKSVALTSLILALDKVDSTLGHFVSYLQDWSPRSYKNLRLGVPKIFVNEHENRVLQKDIFDLAGEEEIDLAYFDPPYGSNNDKMPPSRVRYSSYYHLWTTICLNDRPELFGKVNRRADTSDVISGSVFEEFRKNDKGRFVAVDAIERLIRRTKARWIILSYSSGGRATAGEINQVLEENGRVLELVEVDYRRNVMAGMRWTHEWVKDAEQPNREFLFLLEK